MSQRLFWRPIMRRTGRKSPVDTLLCGAPKERRQASITRTASADTKAPSERLKFDALRACYSPAPAYANMAFWAISVWCLRYYGQAAVPGIGGARLSPCTACLKISLSQNAFRDTKNAYLLCLRRFSHCLKNFFKNSLRMCVVHRFWRSKIWCEVPYFYPYKRTLKTFDISFSRFLLRH